jgi:hypothetical protein
VERRLERIVVLRFGGHLIDATTMLKRRADANPGPRRAVLSFGAAMLCSGLMAGTRPDGGSNRRGRVTELVIDGPRRCRR